MTLSADMSTRDLDASVDIKQIVPWLCPLCQSSDVRHFGNGEGIVTKGDFAQIGTAVQRIRSAILPMRTIH